MIERFKRALREERGAMMFVVIALSLALLIFVPVLVDYASLHYARRVAQMAADAGALAAAVEYAQEDYWDYMGLSTPWWHPILLAEIELFCCDFGNTDNMCEVMFVYNAHVLLNRAFDVMGGGRDKAEEYVERNGSRMTGYDNWKLFYLIPRIKKVGDSYVFPVGIEVSAEREVPMIYGNLYGRRFKAPAEATAEAYLDDYNTMILPCWCGDWCFWYVYLYDYYWKVRLVE